MYCLVLGCATSEVSLWTSSQGPTIGSTITSLLTTSAGITPAAISSPANSRHYVFVANDADTKAVVAGGPTWNGPVRGPLIPSVTPKTLATTKSASTDRRLGLNTEVSVSTDQVTHSQSTQPVSQVAKDSSTKPQPSISTTMLALETLAGKTVLAHGTSTPIPSPPTDFHLSLVFDAQSATANSKSEYISPSSQTLSLGSTSDLGSGTPTSVSAPSKFGTQHIMASDSATSLSPHATALPDFFKSPPALTIGEQTITADSLGKYLLGNQTLTRSGVITVSGITISLAPNASDVVVGTSTKALRPTLTAGLGSGANGTKVQKFSGDALGVRDGLWGSSLMLLASFFVLLWL